MSPVLERTLTFAVIALTGVVAIHTWKTSPQSTDSATPPASTVRQSQDRPHNTAPSSLIAITDPGEAWQVRIGTLRNALQTECGEREIRYLYELLAKGPSKGELPEHWYVIANEFMDQLLRHDSDAERFSSNLISLLKDSGQPVVLRDYAVQHLVTWLNPHSRQNMTAHSDQGHPAPQPDPEIAARVLQSIVAAATDPSLEQSSVPGTTLMMIVNLVRATGDVDCTQAIASLKPWLTRALEDGSTLGTPVRVSAVQAAAVLAPEEFRPVLRRIAYQENGQSSLRLPAIAAIAHCGETADLEKLQQIARTRPELFYAAKEAGATLTSRLAQTKPSP
jgi:hypothetical protein